jgi:hypothetical protein
MSPSVLWANGQTDFLDHLLRHTPAGKFIPLKSSFFSRDDEKHRLGGAVEAFKGVYQSIRACQVSATISFVLLDAINLLIRIDSSLLLTGRPPGSQRRRVERRLLGRERPQSCRDGVDWLQ